MTDFRSKFQRPAPAAGKPAAPTGARRSRLDGVRPQAPRTPMAPPGLYSFEWVHAEPTRLRDGYKVTLRIVEISDGGEGVARGVDQSVRPGDHVIVTQKTSSDTGASAVVAMAMAFAGYDDADVFSASCSGAWIEDCFEGVRGDLVGRVAYAQVTRGKEVVKDGSPTGDYYRNYGWVPSDAEPVTGDL